jgi:hypothetical protein
VCLKKAGGVEDQNQDDEEVPWLNFWIFYLDFLNTLYILRVESRKSQQSVWAAVPLSAIPRWKPQWRNRSTQELSHGQSMILWFIIVLLWICRHVMWNEISGWLSGRKDVKIWSWSVLWYEMPHDSE